MKVLHVISSMDPRSGGPASALSGLARAQISAGCQVSIVSTYISGNDTSLTDGLKAFGAVIYLVGPAHGKFHRHPDLATQIDTLVKSCDVVHIHALWEEIQHLAARAAQKYKKRYVMTVCAQIMAFGLNNRHKWAKKILLAWRVKKNLLGASAIHYATEVERQESPVLPARVLIEPNGIELSEFKILPSKYTFRARYPQIGDRPLIIFLGRLHPGKGLDHLLEALSHCAVKNAMLIAVGPDSPDYKSILEQQTERLGLRERVIFTGALYGPDKIAALADADLFCLPSDSESFSVATIEALAAGTPVLISDKVGVKHEISGAGVGEAVSREPKVLGAALSKWLSDKPLREAAAAKARPFVWKTYDWNVIARRWIAHYESFNVS